MSVLRSKIIDVRRLLRLADEAHNLETSGPSTSRGGPVRKRGLGSRGRIGSSIILLLVHEFGAREERRTSHQNGPASLSKGSSP